MSVYLDASVLVGLFTEDAFSSRADRFLRAGSAVITVSDFAGAELASAVARRVRTGELTADEAHAAFVDFDIWAPRSARRIETESVDVAQATTYVRRLDLRLRTPDALHIALAQRARASLATFDGRMATAARALGLATETL